MAVGGQKKVLAEIGGFDMLDINDRYKAFEEWLDSLLEKYTMPETAVALNFNIYDGSDNTYDIELIAASHFDEGNDDWACDEVFATRNDLLYIPVTEDIKVKNNEDWFNRILPMFISIVRQYLSEGKYRDKLKSYCAVAMGHVSGEIYVLYRSKEI